jgi:hypothetical protein
MLVKMGGISIIERRFDGLCCSSLFIYLMRIDNYNIWIAMEFQNIYILE